MNIARNEIRTGLFVLLSLAVLVSGILYVGAPGVFIPMNKYWVYAENAGGLKAGDDVMLAGRRVGQVVHLYSPVPEATRPNVNGTQNLKLEVLIEVQVDRTASIYKDVRVYITQYGLLGPMILDFAGGREQSGLAESGATFIGERTPGLDQAAPIIAAKLDPALKKTMETLDVFQTTAKNLTKLTAQDGEVNKAMTEFRKLGTQLNDITSETGPLRSSLENVKDLTAEDSPLTKTFRNAEGFTARLNNNKDFDITLRNFRRASAGLNSTIGSLQPKFSNIAHNLEQATDTVKHQPWRLIWPSTKKYPEDKKATPAPRGGRATPTPRIQTPVPRVTPTPPKRSGELKTIKEPKGGSRSEPRLPKPKKSWWPFGGSGHP